MALQEVAVFGGSFNPPHVAHVLAVSLVLSMHEVERVLVVPTFKHPFSKQLVPFDDRVTMAELAMGWLPRVTVSRVEEELGGESRTLHTLTHIAEQHPGWKLRLVVGSDILVEAHKWHRFDRICEIAPLIVLGRVGVTGAEAAAAPGPLLPAVSSTEIRAAMAEGRWDDASALVPPPVLAHVRHRGLYGTAA